MANKAKQKMLGQPVGALGCVVEGSVSNLDAMSLIFHDTVPNTESATVCF